MLRGRFSGFEAQGFVFEWLRVVQNHTAEICEVTIGSPEMIGVL